MNKKKPVGRPKESIRKRILKTPLTLERIGKLYKSGFTDDQVADFLGITVLAIHKWKKLNEFSIPLKDWKKEADVKVEQALYKRAIGYEYHEVTYEKSKVGGLGIKLTGDEIDSIKHVDTYKTKVTTKQVAPEVLAQIFWLKNRQPTVWKDKTDVEHILPDTLVEKYATVPLTEILSKLNALIGESKG